MNRCTTDLFVSIGNGSLPGKCKTVLLIDPVNIGHMAKGLFTLMVNIGHMAKGLLTLIVNIGHMAKGLLTLMVNIGHMAKGLLTLMVNIGHMAKSLFTLIVNIEHMAKGLHGADPGLVVGGGTNPLGALTQYIYTFSEKPHEFKEILVHRGPCDGSIPPKSATGLFTLIINIGCLTKGLFTLMVNIGCLTKGLFTLMITIK